MIGNFKTKNVKADIYQPYLLSMNKGPAIGLGVGCGLIILILIGFSIETPSMYQLDDSEANKTCPNSYLDGMLHETVKREGDIVEREVPPHGNSGGDHYGELEKCSSYFRDALNPIWFGRVQGLHAEN